jgi:Flp pilus assembly secretin CpaC
LQSACATQFLVRTLTKPVAVFDIEVSYDATRLGSELAQRFPNARFRVAAVNGRIMLSGSSPDAVTVDKALMVAKQFGAAETPAFVNGVLDELKGKLVRPGKAP